MSFPAYPDYRDSGVEWVGNIPDHWSVSPIKRAFKIEGGSTPPVDDVNWDGDIAWVTPADLSGLSSIFLDASKRTITSVGLASCGTPLLPVGSLILSTRAPIGSLAIALISMCINQGCKGLVPYANSSAAYFAFVLLTAKTELNNRGRGSTFLEISGDELSRFSVPTPPFAEQTQIARFLGHETARIDALIEEQQSLIELLKEKRQAVISHAVTKGLDPTVQMKDSGVEWLGEVPAHWEANALNKLTVKITNGYVGPTRDILVESGVPYVQATHIKKGVVNFDDAYFVTPEWSMKMRKSILQEADVLIVQTGAGTGDVGVVSSREVGYNCHALIILQAEKNILSGVFLGQVLQSRFGQSVLYSIRTGGMHPHLNCGEVKFVKIPVPPLSEQEEISDFVKTFSEQAEMLIIEAGSTMNLLQERRSALISAAVTGKIDVRGWQPPASASSPESAQEAV